MLFDTPWWLLTIVGVAGAALFMSGNARQNKTILRAGLGVILLSVLLATVSWFVDTPREKVLKGTYALVKAAVDRDKSTIAALLHPKATLGGWNAPQIAEGAMILADRFGLKSARVSGPQTETEPGAIIVKMRVFAEFSNQNIPYNTAPTDWQLNWWEADDGKWLLKEITPYGGGNLSGGQMTKQYFSGTP